MKTVLHVLRLPRSARRTFREIPTKVLNAVVRHLARRRAPYGGKAAPVLNLILLWRVGVGRDPLTTDEFDRRSRSCTPVGPFFFCGPKYVALANAREPIKPNVMFSLLERYVDNSDLGMRIFFANLHHGQKGCSAF
jgi:hypothetical protein